jgi:branched-chain amino acid transport system permease protein
LGYDPYRSKLIVMVTSGLYCGAAGAMFALMFGYVGAGFATIQYSILPMLWVLLGGAGVVMGPFLGALLMFYLIDISSSYTSAHLLVVGVALLILVLFAPRGILGAVRERWLPWLP